MSCCLVGAFLFDRLSFVALIFLPRMLSVSRILNFSDSIHIESLFSLQAYPKVVKVELFSLLAKISAHCCSEDCERFAVHFYVLQMVNILFLESCKLLLDRVYGFTLRL